MSLASQDFGYNFKKLEILPENWNRAKNPKEKVMSTRYFKISSLLDLILKKEESKQKL